MKTNIGFAIHDAARDGRAFEIEDGDTGQALVFGTESNVPLQARGVLPAHFVLLPHEGALLGASSRRDAPAYLGDVPLGTDWTVIEVPCRVRVGAAVIEIFVVPSSFADVECTRVGPLVRPAGAPEVAPPALEATKKTRLKGRTPGDLALLAAARLRDDYKRLSRAKRLMVPIAGLLALLAFAQPSRAGESTAPPGATQPPGPPRTPQIQTSLQALPLQAHPAQAREEAVSGAAAALPAARQGMLPSARSLPSEGRAQLSPLERVVYHKAIEAMLAGDFQTAFRLYDQLAQAHPDAADIRAARRVLAGKIRAAR